MSICNGASRAPAGAPRLDVDRIDLPMRFEQEKEPPLEPGVTTDRGSADVPHVNSQYSLPDGRGSSNTREGVAQ